LGHEEGLGFGYLMQKEVKSAKVMQSAGGNILNDLQIKYVSVKYVK
jgi:hypothetical protein